MSPAWRHPMPDEPTRIGPHLLGRKPNVPDSRDWTPKKLHAFLESSAPPDSIADMTVRQLATTTTYLSSWSALLAFWRWLKAFFKPQPAPSPSPTGTPAWEDLVILDQGNYGTCVGNGWAGFLAAAPIEDPGVTEKLARTIYYESTVIGGSPDNPDAPGGGKQGSTVRDGAKAVKNRGRITAYAFATALSQVDEWLNKHGSVV